MRPIPPETLPTLCGREVGVSEWIVVDQSRINAFAAITEDDQFIHTDPVRAAETPFGGAIAHGFLTLSLLAPMAEDGAVKLKGARMSLNYGFDRVRFINVVPAGRRIRGRFVLKEAVERAPGQFLLRHAVTVEIENQDAPALVVDWLTLHVCTAEARAVG